MTRTYVLSVDGACTGRRAACAAALSVDEEIIDQISRALPHVDGYVLAAEIAGVALASELVDEDDAPGELTVEVDNADVPRVIEDGYRPKQFSRIPGAVLEAAISFCRMHDVRFRVLPRNSTAGLRRAHRLASKRLWAKRWCCFMSAKEGSMRDWNVVVTVFDQEGYRRARSLLSEFGEVGETEFYNVLVLKVSDVSAFTNEISDLIDRELGILNDISRIVPAHVTFDFNASQEFEREARNAVLGWADEFLGKAFYVRLHRRGLKGLISSPGEERLLDDALLAELKSRGGPGRINFEDPDMVIDIETVGNRTGISRWSREELRRHAFLQIG